MSEVNSMYRFRLRSDDLKAQIDKLEGLAHHTLVNPTFETFDAETEDILIKIYGANHQYVESYKYATVGKPKQLSICLSRPKNRRRETFRRRVCSSGARCCKAF